MFAFLLCLFRSSNEIPLPSYPKKYRLKGTWSVPYWNLKQPYYISYDASVKGNECLSENAFNRTHTIRCLKKYKVTQQVYTNIENGEFIKAQYCKKSYADPQDDEPLTEYLPTSNEEWKYKGEYVLLGRLTHKWRKELGVNDWYYDFYADAKTLEPVRLYNYGVSIKHSHPTVYILDIEEYGVTVEESEFYVPSNCRSSNSTVGPTFGRDISVPKPYLQKSNADYSYKPDEQPYCENVTSVDIDMEIPKSFSWRNTPGVLPKVHDQATCGSCYAMAAEIAASAQLSLKSDRNISLSTQQFVDCSWGDNVNNACDGGEGWETYHKLKINNIELTSEDEIPYIGVSGYCPTKVQNPIAKITGCKQFIQDPNDYNHELIKKALIRYGPLMVSIRAGSDKDVYAPFTQLTPEHNTYSSPDLCDAHKWKKQLVDHGVILTGFTTMNVGGEEKRYLEIMNSWSTDWGDHGFGYIDEQYDCGIDSTVLLPTVEFL